MTRSISTRAVRAVSVALFAAGCGGSVATTPTTTVPAPRDPRMAVVQVDVSPLLAEVNRYNAGPRHSYYRPAREAGQQVAVEIGALGARITTSRRAAHPMSISSIRLRAT